MDRLDRVRITKKRINADKLHYLKIEMLCYHDTKKILNNPNLLSSKQIIYMQNIVDAIDKALNILQGTKNGDLKRQIIEDVYWYSPHLPYEVITGKHYVHLNSIRYYETQFFYILADCLGLKLDDN